MHLYGISHTLDAWRDGELRRHLKEMSKIRCKECTREVFYDIDLSQEGLCAECQETLEEQKEELCD